MDAPSVLAILHHLGIEVHAEDDRLICTVPPGVTTDGIRSAISANKSELIGLVRGGPAIRPEPIVFDGIIIDVPNPERRRRALEQLGRRGDANEDGLDEFPSYL